ncbi:hypothetical protein NSP_22960 [Nodularia spumigena CCY9414]|nr:hypothetical protein NSP_22960 [Nodularia spumigena CCY9414]
MERNPTPIIAGFVGFRIAQPNLRIFSGFRVIKERFVLEIVG